MHLKPFKSRLNVQKSKNLLTCLLSKGNYGKLVSVIDFELVFSLELWLLVYRYLLDSHWMKQWKKYVSWDQWEECDSDDPSSHPGSIDNSSLLEGKTGNQY